MQTSSNEPKFVPLIPIDPVHHVINQMVWCLPHQDIAKLEVMRTQTPLDRIKTIIQVATARATIDPAVRVLLSAPEFLNSLKHEALDRQRAAARHVVESNSCLVGA